MGSQQFLHSSLPPSCLQRAHCCKVPVVLSISDFPELSTTNSKFLHFTRILVVVVFVVVLVLVVVGLVEKQWLPDRQEA